MSELMRGESQRIMHSCYFETLHTTRQKKNHKMNAELIVKKMIRFAIL